MQNIASQSQQINLHIEIRNKAKLHLWLSSLAMLLVRQ